MGAFLVYRGARIVALSFGSFSLLLYDRFMGSMWEEERQGVNRCYCGVSKGTQANENIKT